MPTYEYECTKCGYLRAGGGTECPACGTEMDSVSDVIEIAVERAYLAGAAVNAVFGEARQKLLALGGVGARLRY